jgi:hypothetical protein
MRAKSWSTPKPGDRIALTTSGHSFADATGEVEDVLRGRYVRVRLADGRVVFQPTPRPESTIREAPGGRS